MSSSLSQQIVIPGQIIATSNEADPEGHFLRGHGTYIEATRKLNTNRNYYNDGMESNIVVQTADHDGNGDNDDDDNSENNEYNSKSDGYKQQQLVSSVTGTIERVNKLMTVNSISKVYCYPQPGDPVIGRVVSISRSNWRISLSCTTSNGRLANLPLAGMVLPDGMQRVRTSEDALSMRSVLMEGDVISAEVRNIGSAGTSASSYLSLDTNKNGDIGTSASMMVNSAMTGVGVGTLTLHARSMKCGKLENGCLVYVPSYLVGRRKKHFVTLGRKRGNDSYSNSNDNIEDGFDGVRVDVFLGCNGFIWIQKEMADYDSLGETPVPEVMQKIRAKHAKYQMTLEERSVIARVRNAIEALKMVSCRITPENIEKVVRSSSVDYGVTVMDMLRPEIVLKITACTRENRNI